MTVPSVSPWGQLLGFEEPSSADKRANRRVHVRHPCDLLASCHTTDGKSDILASVVNISRGGVGLLADKPLKRGAVLRVELPLADDRPPFRLLACVLHASKRPDGFWILGCAFVTELDDADLRSLGIDRADSGNDEERSEAHPCRLDISYRPIGFRLEKPCRGTVTEIGGGRACLVTDQPVELGSVLRLELRRTSQDAELKMLACVVRVSPRGENKWMWACNFIRQITRGELQALLDIPDSAAGPKAQPGALLEATPPSR